MTDYAKHIETLGHIGLLRIEAREAINVARELMRAALPKDAADPRSAEDDRDPAFAAGLEPLDSRLKRLALDIKREMDSSDGRSWRPAVLVGALVSGAALRDREIELSAAKAEIARLLCKAADASDDANRLASKLTQLRAAAELFTRGEITPNMWRAAIEASR